MRILWPTKKEEGLKKEMAIFQNTMVTENKGVRYVPGDKTPAYGLTKKTSGEFLTRAIQKNLLKKLDFYDCKLVADEMLREAERDIHLEPKPVRRSQINMPWMSAEKANNAGHCLVSQPIHNASYAMKVDTIMSSSVTSDDNQYQRH